MKGVIRIGRVAILTAGLLLAVQASAQDEEPAGPVAPDEPVEAKGVGISGGVLLGAEVVLGIEALIGVEKTWAWIVFPILGAAGGGVGGYFLEQASPEGAVAMLVSSMALIIPTAVAISASTAYDPEDEGAVQDTTSDPSYSFELTPTGESGEEGTTTEVESRPEEVPEGAPAIPPGQGSESEASPPETPTPEPPSTSENRLRHLSSGSLFHIGRDFSAGFGVPAIGVRPTSHGAQDAVLGVNRGLEVNVPLIRIDLP